MSLEHWVQLAKYVDASWTIDNVYPSNDVYNWEQTSGSTLVVPPKPNNQITKEFYVSVDNKDPNRYPEGNAGSTSVYYIDGYHAPELKLKIGKYRFHQKHGSNNTHPLVFREDNAASGFGNINAEIWYGYTDITDPNNPTTIRIVTGKPVFTYL